MKKKQIKIVMGVLIVLVGAGIMNLIYLNRPIYPINAINFLKEYYTVPANVNKPSSISDIKTLQLKYTKYMSDIEVDKMIRNKTIVVPYRWAKENRCTLEAKKVKLRRSKENSSLNYDTYEYEVKVKVNKQDDTKRYIRETGTIRMSLFSENPVIIYFFPTRENLKVMFTEPSPQLGGWFFALLKIHLNS